MTRRTRRSKSFAPRPWLTTQSSPQNFGTQVMLPAGVKPVKAGKAFSLGSHAMRIRCHALPPTQNSNDTNFLVHSCCICPTNSLPLRNSIIPTIATYLEPSTLVLAPSRLMWQVTGTIRLRPRRPIMYRTYSSKLILFIHAHRGSPGLAY